MDFELWLEFELWGEEHNGEADEFFNMSITLEDERRYALNVWTYQFLETARQHAKDNSEHLSGLYELPPDLFVARATREVCEQVVRNLIDTQSLDPAWLVIDVDEPIEEEQQGTPELMEHARWPTQSCTHHMVWRAMWRLNKREKVERFVNKLSSTLNCPLEIVRCERHHKDRGLWDTRLSTPYLDAPPLEAYGTLIAMLTQAAGFAGWHNSGVHFYEDGHWNTELLISRPETVPALEWLSVDLSSQPLPWAT